MTLRVFFLLILHFSSSDVHNEFITFDNAIVQITCKFSTSVFEIHFVNIWLEKTAIIY